MKWLLRYINALSLDVGLGAIASAIFFARLFNASIRPVGFAVLGLTVSIIYSLDHLLDARRIQHPAATFRHQLYQRHFRLAITVTAVAIFADAVAILYIRKPVFIGGLILFAAVLGYLIVNYVWTIPKEPIIAALYTAGVLLPSVALTRLPMAHWPILTITQFLFTALLNLMIFSWFDREHDRRDRLSSFVTHFGDRVSQNAIWLLLSINFVLLFFVDGRMELIVPLLMNATLATIFYFHKFFSVNERYRVIGDAIFFIPLIALL